MVMDYVAWICAIISYLSASHHNVTFLVNVYANLETADSPRQMFQTNFENSSLFSLSEIFNLYH